MDFIKRHFGADFPRAVLFDLDGTLVDSAPDLAVAMDTVLTRLALPVVGEERVRGWVGNGAKKLVHRALAFAVGQVEHQISDHRVDSTLALFLEEYRQTNGCYSHLYPGVVDALKVWRSHRVPMAVVTNKLVEFVPTLLSGLDIDHYFVALVGGACTSQKKPSAMPLLHACEVLNVPPETCLMIGDSCNDVQAARAAKMPVAAVSYGYNHGESIAGSHPDIVVGSIFDLFRR
jgi:phosphoglycolate phosphatase|tara:strand:+ start:6629 stop:7324 length:696 start_codon:yes stop_codon:yes gene_type:complete